MRLIRAATAAAAAVVVLAGCGAPTGTPGLATTPTTTTSTTTGTDAPGRASALSFDLPARYTPDGTRVGDGGELIRSWRMRPGLARNGPSCVIVAGEQPGFSGAFPAAALRAFALGHEEGSDVQYNATVPPIPGTVAGVRQARRYVFSLGAEGTAPGIVLARQYLTTDHTLISLNAAGPAGAASVCGLEAAVGSLRVARAGDQQPPVVLPTPSATVSASPSGSPDASPTGSPTRTALPSGTAAPGSGAESTP